MKLNPLDIKHAEFPRAFNGYNRKRVRELLSFAAEQLETLQADNQSLISALNKKDEHIEKMTEAENDLKRAVIAAERVATEIKHNANREAELVLKEAESVKIDLMRDVEQRLKEAHYELSRLEKEYQLFRNQFKGMLKAYEKSLDQSLSSAIKSKQIQPDAFDLEVTDNLTVTENIDLEAEAVS